ncbi:hypothetical protein WCLP8_2140002 [uncultured Gammaproteobacteria bacterium]
MFPTFPAWDGRGYGLILWDQCPLLGFVTYAERFDLHSGLADPKHPVAQTSENNTEFGSL